MIILELIRYYGFLILWIIQTVSWMSFNEVMMSPIIGQTYLPRKFGLEYHMVLATYITKLCILSLIQSLIVLINQLMQYNQWPILTNYALWAVSLMCFWEYRYIVSLERWKVAFSVGHSYWTNYAVDYLYFWN